MEYDEAMTFNISANFNSFGKYVEELLSQVCLIC